MGFKLKRMIILSRPISWLIIPVGYMLGLFATGNPGDAFTFFQMMMLSFPLSLYIYGINDCYDFETDRINKKREESVIFGAPIAEHEIGWAKKTSLTAGIIVFASTLISFNPIYILTTLVFLLGIYAYSAPPLRVKSIPILDSLTNFMYIYAPFAMAYSLTGGLGFLKIQFIIFSLIFSGMHAIGTVMDEKEDRKAGIKTFATEYGNRLPAVFASFAFLINIPFAYSLMRSAAFFMFLYFLLALSVVIRPTSQSAIRASKLSLVIFFVWFITATILMFSGLDTFNLYN